MPFTNSPVFAVLTPVKGKTAVSGMQALGSYRRPHSEEFWGTLAWCQSMVFPEKAP